jgi:hypothetical protein
MRKKYLRFDVVPVEVAKKILEQESSSAKRNGNGKGKLVVKKSGRAANGRHTVPKRVEVLVT